MICNSQRRRGHLVVERRLWCRLLRHSRRRTSERQEVSSQRCTEAAAAVFMRDAFTSGDVRTYAKALHHVRSRQSKKSRSRWNADAVPARDVLFLNARHVIGVDGGRFR